MIFKEFYNHLNFSDEMPIDEQVMFTTQRLNEHLPDEGLLLTNLFLHLCAINFYL